MKAYDIRSSGLGNEVTLGIPVALDPYPHIVLGEGGNKRATWIALGKQDVDVIMNLVFCPERKRRHPFSSNYETTVPCCEKCGTDYERNEGGDWIHPDKGNILKEGKISDVGIIALKDAEGKPNGRYLIVAPRQGTDDRALVLWRVSSGYRGDANITPGEDVMVIAKDSSWHSGRGNLGSTAEMLAVMKPGQELRASRSGRRVQNTSVKLVYDGQNISVVSGGEEMEAATTNKVEGEYL
jgi:hypothetical protein